MLVFMLLLLGGTAATALAAMAGGTSSSTPKKSVGPAERARLAAIAAAKASATAGKRAHAEALTASAKNIALMVEALRSQNPTQLLALAAELESRGYRAQATDLRTVANTPSAFGADDGDTFEMFTVPDWAITTDTGDLDWEAGVAAAEDETGIPISGYIDAAKETAATAEQVVDTVNQYLPPSTTPIGTPAVYVEVPRADTWEGQHEERMALLARLDAIAAEEQAIAQHLSELTERERWRGWLVSGQAVVPGEYTQ